METNIGLRQELPYLTPLEFYHRTFTGKKLIFGKVTYEK